MARILSIDYGAKRCGIAITDPMRVLAYPLTTVHKKDLLNFVIDYCLQNEVDTIVIGEPINNNEKLSPIEIEIQGFINQLEKKLSTVDIVRIDESFTSKMAVRVMIDAGAKKKQRQKKENIDKISAAIILQDYLKMLEL
ncbi:MAG: Holliday junction resolvase RuvX [Bacteroidales bacterium]|jgi:putative Holliday junction resolvase|nr:Holliday junction resolvase RuvX [Bacteroidales bacterium]MDI9575436.1 Holliday junction resolvase RuvX [Bacteroidota bacterium]MDD2593874.1 Holliday junction resolvase RuvX [Bacteroidales bacterium]MDD3756191.1 Holliday junction resolvase RuvX [Bacteroidales bacterium]MDY0401465.1 Holliday junction resolvase RuvX [Bacteroidales bacterium]